MMQTAAARRTLLLMRYTRKLYNLRGCPMTLAQLNESGLAGCIFGLYVPIKEAQAQHCMAHLATFCLA